MCRSALLILGQSCLQHMAVSCALMFLAVAQMHVKCKGLFPFFDTKPNLPPPDAKFKSSCPGGRVMVDKL